MPPATTLALVTTSAVFLWAGYAVAEDRYGPPPAEPVVSTADIIPAGGWLTWSRKSAQPSPAQPRPRSMVPSPASPSIPSSGRVAGAGLPISLYGAAPARSGRADPGPIDPPPPRPLLAGPAPAAPTQAGSRGGLPPHFYSVQREYATAPQDAALPRQFFADSAAEDLAAPPPPLPPRAVPGSQAATSPANTAANRARATDIETSDSASN